MRLPPKLPISLNMKIAVDIQPINGRYHAQVSTPSFSAVEEQQMRQFGDPLVEVGGAFSGTVTRPGQTDTTLAVVGANTTPASLEPIIVAGAITGVTVVQEGVGYGIAAITVAGDGQGAALAPLFGLRTATVLAGGNGYLVDEELTYTPANAVQPVVVRITEVDSYPLYGVTSNDINAAGTNYVALEQLTYNPPGAVEPVVIRIDTVADVTGAVTSYTILTPGQLPAIPDQPVTDWTGSAAGAGFSIPVPSWGETGSGSLGQVLAYEIVSEGQIDTVPTLPLGTANEWTGSVGGTGFTIPVTVWGITGVRINNGGYGYNTVPLPVEFTIPLQSRRLRSDFPVKIIFDLADYADADARAKVWADTVVARATAAKQALLRMTAPLEGETVTTV